MPKEGCRKLVLSPTFRFPFLKANSKKGALNTCRSAWASPSAKPAASGGAGEPRRGKAGVGRGGPNHRGSRRVELVERGYQVNRVCWGFLPASLVVRRRLRKMFSRVKTTDAVLENRALWECYISSCAKYCDLAIHHVTRNSM